MRYPSLARCAALATIASTLTFVGGSPAGAAIAPTTTITHCYAEVIGQEPWGEYILSELECYDEMADVLAEAAASTEAAGSYSIQSTLATHFDGANYTGSSFSVSGVNCSGGYINLSATWDNRVSSTVGWSCGRVRHFTGANLTGSYQDTVPSGNLSSPVNNASSSIQYLP